TGFYHTFFRGVNHQSLFEEDNDFSYFLNTLTSLKNNLCFELHAYCLMPNHVHLLLRESKTGDISLIMKRLLTKYVMYFNRKYERSGALIANRYKSIPVEVDQYFVPLVCYIHQNPIKAGLVENLEDYSFSSYKDYLKGNGITNTSFSLGLIGRDEWIRLHQLYSTANFDISDNLAISESKIRQIIFKYTNGFDPSLVAGWPKVKRNELIAALKQKEGLSIRQIERATGISRGIISRV
ncbi:MAG: transposase, partial [Negativicutes bacterium]|nr:transposase [Negativicutes bacterium]